MSDAYTNRRAWLALLVKQHGSFADLNRALGRNERDATFSQIANAAPDSKTGEPRRMGSKLARAIEAGLQLPAAALDGPPPGGEPAPSDLPFADLSDLERQALHALRGLTPDQRAAEVARLLELRKHNEALVAQLGQSYSQKPLPPPGSSQWSVRAGQLYRDDVSAPKTAAEEVPSKKARGH